MIYSLGSWNWVWCQVFMSEWQCKRQLSSDLHAQKLSYYPRTDETVTPHQTTLLKLVDSYLQAVQLSYTHSESIPDKARSRLCSMLAGCFLSMSAHAIRSIQRSLRQPDEASASDSSSLNVPPSELDVMLPKVCEALVLVAQCMISLLLEAEDRLSAQRSTAHSSSPNAESNPQAYFINKRDENGAIIENLIGE
jgi:ataxin-10